MSVGCVSFLVCSKGWDCLDGEVSTTFELNSEENRKAETNEFAKLKRLCTENLRALWNSVFKNND